MAKLAELGKIITGNTPKTAEAQNYASNDICFVKPSDFADGEVNHILDTEFYISEYARDKARIIPPSSVLVTCIGILGKVAINKIECAFNQQINAIVPDVAKCLPEYLALAIQSKQAVLRDTANAAVVPILNRAQFSEIEVYLPSLEEQREAVTRMDAVSKLIALRKEQLVKLDELVKARFVEMFGDPMLNSKEWPMHQLSEYILFLTSGSRGWAQYFTEQGEYFITIKNVKNCRITLNDVQHIVPPNNAEAARTKVQEGDLLISITADLGRTGVVSKVIAEHGAYINQHLTCIRLDKSALNPLFVAYYMESEAGKAQFQAKNQNGVKAGLNFNAINSLRLFVPPLELQEKFTSFVEQMDRTKLTIQAGLDKLVVMKKTLMQEYFG